MQGLVREEGLRHQSAAAGRRASAAVLRHPHLAERRRGRAGGKRPRDRRAAARPGETPAGDAARRCGVGRRDGARRGRAVAGAAQCRAIGGPRRIGACSSSRSAARNARGPIVASALAAVEPPASQSATRRPVAERSSMPRESRASARRPAFSDFKVGAALETTDGRIITGCNIENSTYGLTMCAERVAIFKAISEGHRSFRRIAVVADTIAADDAVRRVPADALGVRRRHRSDSRRPARHQDAAIS